MSKKYMAYVGSYSYTGAAKGITVYDVDVQAGKFTKRCEVEVDNSSYVKASHSKKRSGLSYPRRWKYLSIKFAKYLRYAWLPYFHRR